MRSAFDKGNITKAIQIKLKIAQKNVLHFVVQHDNKPYSNWMQTGFIYKDFVSWISHGSTLGYENLAQTLNKIEDTHSLEKLLKRLARLLEPSTDREILDDVVKTFLFQIKDKYGQDRSTIKNFIIYSPENSSLRIFEKEGQIQPLGIHGEGLFKLLKVLDNIEDKINTIKEKLELIDWFNDFQTPNSNLERNIQIRDRYIDKELPYFNQRSSNEGFLFLMFYFALFVSESTPKFFAIDNIENALNPKLCTRLIQELVELAKKYDKQVIFTTHNPAILDGLDLHDEEQRLFVIYRNMDGHTQAKQIEPLEPLDDGEIVPLSEAFINGYIGGLPKNF